MANDNSQRKRGQGAFEYLLLLGGSVLVAVVVIMMVQGSASGANNTLGNASSTFQNYAVSSLNSTVGSFPSATPTPAPTAAPTATPTPLYSFLASAGPGGSVSCAYTNGTPASCSSEYASGTQVNVTASPNASYAFSSWDCGGSCSPTTTSPTTVTITTATTVTAGFAQVFSFSATSGANGAVSCAYLNATAAPCSANYLSGTPITVTGTPNANYTFSSWTCTGSACSPATTSPTTVTISAATTVAASFAAQPYSFSATAGTGGSVSCNYSLNGTAASCSSAYVLGTQINVTAAASGGFSFSGWTCTAGACSTNATSPTMATVGSSTTVVGNFAQKVNGSCGSSNGGSSASAPSTNLCVNGSASAVTGPSGCLSGTWNWFCNGSNGGTNASCTATKPVTYLGVNHDGHSCDACPGIAYWTRPSDNYVFTSSLAEWGWGIWWPGYNMSYSCSAQESTFEGVPAQADCRLSGAPSLVGWTLVGQLCWNSGSPGATCAWLTGAGCSGFSGGSSWTCSASQCSGFDNCDCYWK